MKHSTHAAASLASFVFGAGLLIVIARFVVVAIAALHTAAASL